MTDTTIAYNPTIQSLLAKAADDWGDPTKNRVNLIPYGIKPIDMALYGIDRSGELVLIQGREKERKTTLVLNVIVNYMTWEGSSNKPVTNIDTLESGMRPEKVRDALISILASRYLFGQGHRPGQPCPVCRGTECTQLALSPKFLRYNTRSALQLAAIDYAMDEMNTWPLLVHGAGIHQGNTRVLHEAVTSRKERARWIRLIEEFGMEVNVIDHLQQYAYDDDPTDYEKQIRAVSAVGDFVSQYNIPTLALAQVSLKSVQDARTSGGRLIAAGGAKGAQEANTVFSTSYKPGSGYLGIKIEESRDAGSFTVYQRLDDVSGSFYGEATLEPPI